MPKHSSHILEYARRGAEHRYQELKAEIALLVKHFPHLTGGGRNQVSVLDAVMGGAAPVSKRRRTMSAAARKAVSARMTKYWAALRKSKQGGRKQAAKA